MLCCPSRPLRPGRHSRVGLSRPHQAPPASRGGLDPPAVLLCCMPIGRGARLDPLHDLWQCTAGAEHPSPLMEDPIARFTRGGLL